MGRSIVVDILCPTVINASLIEGGELIDIYGTFGVEGIVCGTGTSWNVNLVKDYDNIYDLQLRLIV